MLQAGLQINPEGEV